MKWAHFFTSPVGRKIVMALSGIFLVTFLIVHVGVNSCIFYDLPFLNSDDNGSMFNRAAYFMGNSLIVRTLEIVLFAGFIIHIIQGYVLELQNRKLRGSGYKIGLGNRGSTWMSRSMAILGTLIFFYLIIHVIQFWIPSRITHDVPPVSPAYPGNEGRQMHNMFLLMFNTFQNVWMVVLYLAGVASLAFHLFHGFHSAFRSMGVHNKKYLNMLKVLGYGFTIIVSVLFALMPISMYLRWVSPE